METTVFVIHFEFLFRNHTLRNLTYVLPTICWSKSNFSYSLQGVEKSGKSGNIGEKHLSASL